MVGNKGITPGKLGALTEPGDTRPIWLVVAVQFVIVPMIIVALCVGVVMIFRWMTFERRDLKSYLSALRSGPTELGARGLLNYIEDSKRWQGIFDMTQELNGRRADLLREQPDIGKKLLVVFNEAKARGDWKVRQYLALVLGVVGDRDAVPALMEAAETPPADTRDGTALAAIKALALMEDPRALPLLTQLIKSPERSIRLTAAWALGFFSPEDTTRVLETALNDADPFVSWNAAMSLARHNHVQGAAMLERLASPDFLAKQAPQVSELERSEYRVAAVHLLAQLTDRDRESFFRSLSRDDADYRVRQAAIEAMQPRNKK